MPSFHEILINVTSTFTEAGGFGRARDEIKGITKDTDTLAASFTGASKALSRFDRNDIAERFDAEGIAALNKEFENLEKRLEAVSRTRALDPRIRKQAEEAMALVQDERNALVQLTDEYADQVREQVALRQQLADRRTLIAKWEAKAEQETLTRQQRSRLKTYREEARALEASVKERQTVLVRERPEVAEGLRTAGRDVGNIGRQMDRALASVDNFGDHLDRLSTVLTRVSPIIRGVTILVGVTMVSAIAAVVGSLTAAAGAVAAMAVSFGAMLGPAIGVAVAFFARFASIVKALTAQQKLQDEANRASMRTQAEAAQQAETLRNARNSLRDATEGVATAERQLANATDDARQQIVDAQDAHAKALKDVSDAASDLRDAERDAWNTIRDSVERATDAARDYESAQLGIEEANLNYRQAKQDLAEYRQELGLSADAFNDLFAKFSDVDVDMSGFGDALRRATGGTGTTDDLGLEERILRVRRAKLNEKDATDQLGDSERNLNEAVRERNRLQRTGLGGVDAYVAAQERMADAQERSADTLKDLRDLQRDGVQGSEQVISAQQALRDAVQRQREATRDLKRVHIEARDALLGSDTAAENLRIALDKLSPAELALFNAVNKVKGGFIDLIRSGTDPIMAKLAELIPGLQSFAPQVQGVFAGLGDAAAGALDDIAQRVGSLKGRLQIGQLFAGSVAGAQEFRRAIGPMFDILMDIAVGAMPMLLDYMRRFRGFLEDIAPAFDNFHQGSEAFDLMKDSLDAIIGLIKQVGRIWLAFTRDAAPSGNEFLKFLQGSAKALADWMNSSDGREDIRQFFHDTLPFAKAAARFFGRLGVVLLKGFQFVAPMFADILDGMTLLLTGVNFLLDGLNQIPAWVRRVIGVLAPFFLALRGIAFVTNIGVRGFRPALGVWMAFFSALSAGFDYIKWYFTDFWDTVKRTFTRVVDWLRDFFGWRSPSTLMRRFGHDLVAGAVQGIRGALGMLRGAAVGMLRAVMGVFTSRTGAAIDAGRELVEAVGRGARNAGARVVSLATWLVGRVSAGVGAVRDRLVGIGERIIARIREGVTSTSSELVDAVSGVFDAIISTVERLLDIHSPSRVFESLGANTIAGFIKGLDRMKVIGFMESLFGRDVWLSAADALKNGSGLAGMLPGIFGKVARFLEPNPFMWTKGESAIPHFGHDRMSQVETFAPGRAGLSGIRRVLSLFKLAGAVGDRIENEIREGLINEMRGLATGGVVTRDGVAQLHGPEAVIPLNKIVLARLGESIVGAMNVRSPALAGSPARGGMVIEHQEINLPAAPGYDGMGDPRHQAALFARELSRRGGGR